MSFFFPLFPFGATLLAVLGKREVIALSGLSSVELAMPTVSLKSINMELGHSAKTGELPTLISRRVRTDPSKHECIYTSVIFG